MIERVDFRVAVVSGGILARWALDRRRVHADAVRGVRELVAGVEAFSAALRDTTGQSLLVASADADNRLMTVEEAAQIMRCDPRTVRRRFADGLRSVKVGHHRLIREGDLADYLDGRPEWA